MISPMLGKVRERAEPPFRAVFGDRVSADGRVVQDFLARRASAAQSRAELVARLDALVAESDARDRTQRGSAGTFPREEIYAARLERFR